MKDGPYQAGEGTENKGNTGQRLTGAKSVRGNDRDSVNEVKAGGEEGVEASIFESTKPNRIYVDIVIITRLN